ncbi:regulator of G-protein signaling protein-like [Polyodon spathula]|uniref:regulator of G-protein signaling protein-like n=1 Tax=Polyodon spathula TaxID=7913 RepID=UPI001B7F4B85|nr:regulator of G-protein signaling protein-like [Polyodon spathula]
MKTSGTNEIPEKEFFEELVNSLKDDVFVDFFNTFLSLPVYGQIPFFHIAESKWIMCPELPYNKRYGSHFILLSIGVARWVFAGQWLLKRCIGSVRGIKRFCSFIKGTCGEELVAFWVSVGRLLQIDETDLNQRNIYLSYLQVLKVVHLQEGSTVAVTYTLLKIFNWDRPFKTRRDLLGKMKDEALLKVRTYWLPQFLTHCKLSMQKVEECRGILQKYKEKAFHEYQGQLTEHQTVNLSVRRITFELSQSVTEPYSSKQTKKRLWNIPLKSARSKSRAKLNFLESPCTLPLIKSKTDPERCSKDNDKPPKILLRPVIKPPSILSFQSLPENLHQYEYLSCVLTADGFAGGPFETFLKTKEHTSELHYLGLWREMYSFLNLVLRSEDGYGHILRQIVAERIVEVYLSKESTEYVQLQEKTTKHLRNLLPAGEVIPWILTAQNEICEILCSSYDDFLDEDDKNFLLLSSSLNEVKLKQRASGVTLVFKKSDQLLDRMRVALDLCQACSSSGDADMLTEDTWALMPLEDIRNGGSIQLAPSKRQARCQMSFTELAKKYPKLAVEETSINYRLYYKNRPYYATNNHKGVKHKLFKAISMKEVHSLPCQAHVLFKPHIFAHWSLAEVLKNPVSTEFFKRYLKTFGAHGPVLFYQEVEKLTEIHDPKIIKLKIIRIVDRFFGRKMKPEVYLQCNDNVILEIPRMPSVTLNLLLAAQNQVLKSLEEKWLRPYQDTFPPVATTTTISDTSIRDGLLKDKLQHIWSAFCSCIRSVCKFRSAMKNLMVMKGFEDYLKHEVNDYSESRMIFVSSSGTTNTQVAENKEEADTTQVKRRVVNNKALIVGFIVNDLSFYLEVEKFRNLADAGRIMASAGMYGENDQAQLHSKAEMIIKLFLRSEISPKHRINIAEVQREMILLSVLHGNIDRSLFHSAVMSIFPTLIFCWKKLAYLVYC